jgi:hypothetical protein
MTDLSRRAIPLGIGLVMLVSLVGLFIPCEVRHSAPFGFRPTFDRPRGIAVPGGFISPNYPNLDRLDLDIRAYSREDRYDLTIHLRPDAPGAPDVRTMVLSVPGHQIWHVKTPLANPFVSVRFPPISESSGRRYYVWIEPGPKHRDDVVTMWSIKSYSHVPVKDVLAAFLREAPGLGPYAPMLRTMLATLMLCMVIGVGWLLGALATMARPLPRTDDAEVAPRWHRPPAGGIH